MNITRKDLREWAISGVTVRHGGELYQTFFNGRDFFLNPLSGTVKKFFYHDKKESRYRVLAPSPEQVNTN